MTTFFFLQEDYDALQKAIGGVEKMIGGILKDMGAGMQDGADTWHDNFDYDEGQRQSAMYSDRIRGLIQIKNNAQVITPKPFNGRVLIGRVVTIQDMDNQEIRKFQIGSFLILGEHREAISYMSPLAKILLGGRMGEIKTGVIGKTNKKFKIINIE